MTSTDTNCESCKQNPAVQIENTDLSTTYKLCSDCLQRLHDRTLRPLEFFNLVSIHGETNELHDDFYDYDTGEAQQPDYDVQDPEDYPFPLLEDVQHSMKKLIDFACVEYFTSDEVIDLIKAFDKQEVLACLKGKVNYDRNINYKCYEIAAKVLHIHAEQWIREQWNNRKPGELFIFAEALAACLPPEEAFEAITGELEALHGSDFNQQSLALCQLKTSKTLDWINENQHKIINVSDNWGTIAALSQFDWATAENWLKKGRPLSLIALDALYFCTGTPQGNWPIMLRENPPSLVDSPDPTVVITTIRKYLETDNVHRVKLLCANIIANLSARDKL